MTDRNHSLPTKLLFALQLAALGALAGCIATAPIDDPAPPAAEGARTADSPVVDDASPADVAAGPATRADENASPSVDTGLTAEDEAGAALQGMGPAESIELYQQLLRHYPDYEGNDEVLIHLGRAYEVSGAEADALGVFDRLVADHPQSRHLADAQFRRAEILFAMGRYAEAERAYAAVVALGEDAPRFEQALYKHGWSLFKQGQQDGSLSSFYALLDRYLTSAGREEGKQAPVPLRPSLPELVEDALRAIVLAYSYENGSRSIDAYFDAHGMPEYAHLVYRRLGDLYIVKERFTDAADSYHAFVVRAPNHPAAPLLQIEAIGAYRSGEFARLVLDGEREFVERYGINAPFWTIHERRDHRRVIEQLKVSLTDLARHYHAEAQRSGEAADYSLAARWYREYLGAFPDDPAAPEKSFLLAETLFDAARYREAAAQYEQTAYDYPRHEHSAEAGYAALLAYERHRTTMPQAAERNSWHLRAIESALRFAETFPRYETTPAVLTTAAEDLARLGDRPRAIDVGHRVLALDPPVDAGHARAAWSVIADSEFDLEHYDRAEAGYQALRPLVADEAEAETAVVERLASSIYKQGEQAQAAGDLEAAVQHYSRVARVAPESSIRINADYDAAAVLVQLGDWSRAVPALEAFRSAYPAHDFTREATRTLAVAYEDTGRPERAAAEFARISADPGEPEAVRREANWRSAELFAEAGNPEAARKQYEQYVEQYAAAFDTAIEARLRLADLARDRVDSSRRQHWLAEIVAADAAAGDDRSGRSRYLAATATLELADAAAQAFRVTSLVIPLDRSLRAKRELMEQALTRYASTSAYAIAAVTTAATYRIAEIYQQMAYALMESERPAGLSDEELEQYDVLLEEQAFPFEEKAIEIHQANAARAAEGIYDEWVRRSYAELARLLPVRYAKTELNDTVMDALD